MTLDSALGAAHPLPGDAPQQPLALVAVGGARGRPQHEVVRRRARDGVDERLQRLLVHVHLLLGQTDKGERRERGVRALPAAVA